MMFGIGLAVLAVIWIIGMLGARVAPTFDWLAAHILLITGAIEIVMAAFGVVR